MSKISGIESLEAVLGSTVAVSPANSGRLRYNEVANQWEASANGGAYAAFPTPSRSGTWEPIERLVIGAGGGGVVGPQAFASVLDLDSDLAYRVDHFCINTNAGLTRHLILLPNGLTTNAHTTLHSGSSGAFAQASLARLCISQGTREFSTGTAILARGNGGGTEMTMFAQASRIDAGVTDADLAHQIFSGIWNTTANMTSLSVGWVDGALASQTDLATGSWIQLSRLVPPALITTVTPP